MKYLLLILLATISLAKCGGYYGTATNSRLMVDPNDSAKAYMVTSTIKPRCYSCDQMKVWRCEQDPNDPNQVWFHATIKPAEGVDAIIMLSEHWLEQTKTETVCLDVHPDMILNFKDYAVMLKGGTR